AKVREQYLPVAPNEQVTGFDILMNQSLCMDEVEGIGSLLQVGDKLFGKGSTSSAILSAKEVVDSLRGVFHDEIGSLVVKLAEVVDGHDVGMLQIGDPACLIKEAAEGFLVELIEPQHFEGQDAAERCRFAHFVDVSIAACADEGNDFIDTDVCAAHQEVTARTIYSIVGNFVSTGRTCIQTTSQRLLPLFCHMEY